MVEVVINYDPSDKVYKAYEPSTDTLFITASLGETFNNLEAHLLKMGLIAGSLLAEQDITYHLDSATFIAMVKSNATLLKRLNNAPSSFMMSEKRLGISNSGKDNNKPGSKKDRKMQMFSKSNFMAASKKFGK